MRTESVGIGNEETGRPLTFGLVQNCTMVKSQKWEPREDDSSEEAENQSMNVGKRETGKCSLLNSKEYIQEKQMKEEILDEILMKRSV